MNLLGQIRELAGDIAIVAGEIAALLVILFVLNFAIKLAFRRLLGLPWLSRWKERAESVRSNVRGFLVLLGAGLGVSLIGFNVHLMYQGRSVGEDAAERIASVSPAFWAQLGLALAKVIALVIVATLINRWLRNLLLRLRELAKAWEQLRANDESIEALFGSLIRIQTNSLWLLALYAASSLLPFPAAVASAVLLVLRVYLIIALGLLAGKAVTAIVDSLDALSVKYSSPDNLLRFYDHLRMLVPLAKRSLEWVIYVYVATLVVMQLEFISQLAVHGPQGIKIIGIFFFSRVVVEIANLVVDRLIVGVDEMSREEGQRRQTLVPLIKSIFQYVIYFVAIVMSLGVLGVNLTPILTGAGIAGLVLGLGAQSVIRDVITGFFIIFENHFFVGDFIETGDARGVVEAIEIRTTRIRDPGGQQHILRNGQIGHVINYSKGYTRAVVEVGVAYDSDLDRVYRVLRDTGAKLKEENEFVIEPTIVSGLDNFGESELTIRTVTRVEPGHHLDVGRDLRKRIKEAFDREGIEIPFARRVLIFKPEDDGQQARKLDSATRSGESAR